MHRRDFLRHIVNPLVAEYAGGKKLRAIEDIKKLIAEGELRYGFSAYGGSLDGLKKYIESKDFDLVIDLLKNNNALDLLLRILEEAKKTYSGHPGLVSAIDKRIEEIRRGISQVDRGRAVRDAVEQSLSGIPGLSVTSQGDRVIVDIRGIGKASIKINDKYTLSLSIQLERSFDNYEEAVEALKSLVSALEKIAKRGK